MRLGRVWKTIRWRAAEQRQKDKKSKRQKDKAGWGGRLACAGCGKQLGAEQQPAQFISLLTLSSVNPIERERGTALEAEIYR